MFVYVCPAGIFAPVSKISKAVDQTPSSVTSTPRTPRIDLASRLAGKTKKEKEKKEREKGNRALMLTQCIYNITVCLSPWSQCHRDCLLRVPSPEEEGVSSQSGSRGTQRGSWRSSPGGWTEERHRTFLWKDRLRSRSVCCSSAESLHCTLKHQRSVSNTAHNCQIQSKILSNIKM